MRIYSISRKDTGQIIYIGSTHQLLCDRKSNHHYNYKSRPLPVHIYMKANGGWEGYDFKTISEHPGITRTQLKILEGGLIKTHLPICNHQINTVRTTHDVKEYEKQYYQEHKEEKCLYSKEWASKRYICDCGADVRYGEKARHFKSKKHQTH